jgi:hypothetical protein
MFVLQIVINNGFYCRKSYRLLKNASKPNTQRHLSALHQTWTLIFLGIGLPSSRNRLLTIAIQTANNTCGQWSYFTVLQFLICHLADDKFVQQNMLWKEGK